MEKSGGLENRESMKVYTITTTNDNLASEHLAAFLGFLDKRLREHDYLLGRISGMQVIEHILNQKNNANALGNHLPLNVASRSARISESKLQLTAMKLSEITMNEVNYDECCSQTWLQHTTMVGIFQILSEKYEVPCFHK